MVCVYTPFYFSSLFFVWTIISTTISYDYDDFPQAQRGTAFFHGMFSFFSSFLFHILRWSFFFPLFVSGFPLVRLDSKIFTLLPFFGGGYWG
ncbi:hypothetical protein BU24DRAFT_277656 [Aaosphaeria arxii CBS 175.79]|uniref:Uncharacterized protein n=1 Tax=Aaosphaeria arxii CBS 175.79 TaxID=1450172 RepID=A0A6A5XEK6_9PLEO|nr:uncharacterized protein BU24DRAFT_277656 [Aaosphaeria arxii CBS 175.79]KAF2011266.1 hypothetical protein BU24DRAFT_277656 [Aaosphaeria arxii CBS 175.79]